MCSLSLWLVLFLEWMSAYFIFYFFTTFPLCNLQHTSLLTTLLKLLSEITLTLVLLTTSSWKLLYWLPETLVCKHGSPHESGFSSSCCCEHPKTSDGCVIFFLSSLWIMHAFLKFQWFHYVHVQCLEDIRYSINVCGRYVDDF